jgi:hypothetical protein
MVWRPSGVQRDFVDADRRSSLRCDLRLLSVNPHGFDVACDIGGGIEMCPITFMKFVPAL